MISRYVSPLSILILLLIFIGSCTFTRKVTDGPTAYELKQYSLAVELLQKEYDKEKSRVEKGKIAFMLGDSYREMNRPEAAIDWFKIAYDNQYGVDALKAYAYTLKQNEQYREAIEAFKELGYEIGSPYEYRKDITACEVAIDWRENPNTEYQVELAPFNTGRAEYAPNLISDNELLITSDRVTATGEETYQWTGNEFSDLFLVDLDDNSVRPFDPIINTPFNEGTGVLNPDGNTFYFTRCFSPTPFETSYCKLMVSRREGNQWTPAEVLPFVKDQVNYGHPTLSADGNTLIFSCNDPEGWGGFDLYTVQKEGLDWGFPELMSRSINTPMDEQFPYLDQDTLYFSSNGHTGMGGLDIFRIYRRANGNWSSAYNLKPPINSGKDDFGITLLPGDPADTSLLAAGYFSSNRFLGEGGDDIYRFEKRIPEKTEEEQIPPEDIVYKILLDGYVLEKIFQDQEDPNSKYLGRRPLPQSEVVITYRDQTRTVTVGEDGKFSLELEPDTDYRFLASQPGYLNQEASFSTKGIGKDPRNPVQTFEVEIVLDRIYLNQEITLENIYYDFDKWDIRDDAKPTLNKLAKDLTLNPGIRIQMGSHTDCRGNLRYNEDLSQRRAQSAVSYLISQGVSPDRLEAIGYGESSPAVNCICSQCTEDEHQENRRTTFKIIE
jgi:peptidoglycan-associated lipoprotein